VVYQQALEVGVAIVLAGAVVLVVGVEGRQTLKPIVDVLDDPRLGIVDVDPVAR